MGNNFSLKTYSHYFFHVQQFDKIQLFLADRRLCTSQADQVCHLFECCCGGQHSCWENNELLPQLSREIDKAFFRSPLLALEST